MCCPFCDSSKILKTFLPPNKFNNKIFNYNFCGNCKLIFISPIPDYKDLVKMYPSTYQGTIETNLIDINKKMPGLRFSYKEQLDQINHYITKHCRMIDFGCGTGHFIFNAKNNGILMEGVEFSSEVVQNLKNQMPENNFYTITDFYSSTLKYYIIRLSNVLEHFTNPQEEFHKLLLKLESQGIVLLEGPLEKNKSLVNFIKWNYLKLRYLFNKQYTTTHSPTHIFFSNHKNQLSFFEKMGLQTLHYKVIENTWPYPESITQVKSLSLAVKYIIGLKSRFLSLFIPMYGNTFLYVGRKK